MNYYKVNTHEILPKSRNRTLPSTSDTVHGILQGRILEWVAFSFPRGSSQPRDWTQVSCIAGIFSLFLGFPGGSAGKESACNAGDLGSIPGLGRFPGEGKGYPLQYSALENYIDCIVHGVAKNLTWLNSFHFTFCSSPIGYWTPSDLGGWSSGVISFCLFILFMFMGFLWQQYWSGLPFFPPVDHVLSVNTDILEIN